jgi:ribose transport system ATP-binding protein
VDPKEKVGDLSVSQQQVVEIVKALSMNCKVIIFDEPTASLTEQETERLFSIIANLKARGLCVLYISHRCPKSSASATRCRSCATGAWLRTVPSPRSTRPRS